MKRSSTAAQLLVAGCIGLGSFDVVAQDVALHATPSMDAFCRAANYTFPYYPEVWWDHNLTGANPNGGAREGLTGFWEYDRIEVPPYTDWRINRIEMVVQAYGGGDTPQAQQRAYDVALSSFLVSPPVRIYTGSATSPDLDAPRIYNQGAAGQPVNPVPSECTVGPSQFGLGQTYHGFTLPPGPAFGQSGPFTYWNFLLYVDLATLPPVLKNETAQTGYFWILHQPIFGDSPAWIGMSEIATDTTSVASCEWVNNFVVPATSVDFEPYGFGYYNVPNSSMTGSLGIPANKACWDLDDNVFRGRPVASFVSNPRLQRHRRLIGVSTPNRFADGFESP
ncbi:MAG: hypothetical protein R3F18_18510 [Lysobacterales bacterium]